MRVRWLPMLLVAASCRDVPPPRGAHTPPTAKDALALLLAQSALPLKQASHCESAGTETADATLGRYLAGWLAELHDPAAKNWIVTNIDPDPDSRFGPVWITRIMLQHQAGEDEWGWGVRFAIRQSDGEAVPESFECLGAG